MGATTFSLTKPSITTLNIMGVSIVVTQNNSTQHNGIKAICITTLNIMGVTHKNQYRGTQQISTQHNDYQHNDTQHNGSQYSDSKIALSVTV
jgi:hypothetical protein